MMYLQSVGIFRTSTFDCRVTEFFTTALPVANQPFNLSNFLRRILVYELSISEYTTLAKLDNIKTVIITNNC